MNQATMDGKAANEPTFGRVCTAMITPLMEDGGINQRALAALVPRILNSGTECIVLNGTTGEFPTTSESEQLELLRCTRELVVDGTRIVAGVGTYDTRHSVRMAKLAADAGADGLMAVVPYYSRPQQRGIEEHFVAIADATSLPLMIYDIPSRTGVKLARETILGLAAHPRIVALKDATGDLPRAAEIIHASPIALYSGDDQFTFAFMKLGAVGVVSVLSQVLGEEVGDLVGSAARGEFSRAYEIHAKLGRAFAAMGVAGPGTGLAFVKAALALQGLDVGEPRLPFISLSSDERASVASSLEGYESFIRRPFA